ncbi:MAG: hypothetical protein LBC99_06500 [Spirochaetota bacterium]|jgi:hypothetical protein|nr:hypothetical protein [Spirochaetota bacterium]
MNDIEGLKIFIERLSLEIAKLRLEVHENKRHENLPEWVDLKQAVALKRGLLSAMSGLNNDKSAHLNGAYSTCHARAFLQPCCGRNSKLVGGVKCWKRENVIKWLNVTDSELAEYAKEFYVKIPLMYMQRSESDGAGGVFVSRRGRKPRAAK